MVFIQNIIFKTILIAPIVILFPKNFSDKDFLWIYDKELNHIENPPYAWKASHK